jgi:hypothetical protein
MQGGGERSPRRRSGGRELAPSSSRRSDALRHAAETRSHGRAADDDTFSDDDNEPGYAQSISEASERVMHGLSDAPAFCSAPPVPVLPSLTPLPSPAQLYSKLSTQVRAWACAGAAACAAMRERACVGACA